MRILYSHRKVDDFLDYRSEALQHKVLLLYKLDSCFVDKLGVTRWSIDLNLAYDIIVIFNGQWAYGIYIPHFDLRPPKTKCCDSKQTRGPCLDRENLRGASQIMADRGDGKEAPPAICPEDTVEYRIYCSAAGSDLNGGRSDDALSKLALECNYSCRQLSSGHVWHYSRLTVRPVAQINGVGKLFIGL